MKSLIESKSEVSDKTSKLHNSDTAKEVKNRNYTDLPKHGFHFVSRKIKTQLVTFSENGEGYMKPDKLTASEIGMKSTEVVERECAHNGNKPENLKYNTVNTNTQLEHVTSEFDVNLNVIKGDEMIQGYKSSKQKSGNVFRSNDKSLATQSQSKSSVVKIDIDLTEDNSKFDFDDFEVNEPSSSGRSNPGTGTKDNRQSRLNTNKSVGASLSTNVKSSSNENRGLVKCASVKDKTSKEHNQTIIKSNNRCKNVENEKMKQSKFGYTKPTNGKPYTSVPKTNFDNTVYDNSKVVVPNTPPNRERQMMRSRSLGYKAPHSQASKSTEIPVNARQDISKVNNFYRTSCTETQASSSKSKPPYGSKAISKFNNLSKTKSSNQHNDAQASLGKIVNKNNGNHSWYGNNDREAHIKTNNSIGKPIFASEDMSKFDRMGKTTRKDQHLHTKSTMKNFAHVNKSNPMYNSLYTTSDKQTHGKLKEIPCFETKNISKINTFDDTTRRDQHRQAIGKSSQANRGSPKRSNFYNTSSKQTYLHSSKETRTYETKDISKTNTIAKTSNTLKTSSVGYKAPKDMDGGLGSDEDLFGSDDGLDELLASSFTDDLDHNGHLGTQGDNNNLKWIENDVLDDDGGMKDLLGNLDNDMDDDTLVACCDYAMSPTIPVRENGPNSRLSGSLRNEVSSKGVKRKLDIPDAQSKVRRSNTRDNVGFSRGSDKLCNNDADERIKECPFCAKNFHFG